MTRSYELRKLRHRLDVVQRAIVALEQLEGIHSDGEQGNWTNLPDRSSGSEFCGNGSLLQTTEGAIACPSKKRNILIFPSRREMLNIPKQG